MMEKTGMSFVEPNRVNQAIETDSPTAAPDPFDLENLRVNQDHLRTPAAKKRLTEMVVRKPHRQDWFRVHPDMCYPGIGLLEVEREIYLLTPNMVDWMTQDGGYTANLYLAINRHKVPFLIPVRLPGEDGKQMRWHSSLASAVDQAKTNCTKACPNMDAGYYDTYEAMVTIPEPQWPDLSMKELVRLAFKDRLIETEEHPVYQALKGRS